MKLFIFVFVVTIFRPGYGLECYKCNGCETASVLTESCRNLDPETQTSGCLTQKVRTGGSRDLMTIKKCSIYGNGERFECPTLPSGETVLCQICHTDYCNNGNKIFVSIIFLCSTLVFTKFF